MPRYLTTARSVLIACTALALASPALGSQNFPAEVKAYWDTTLPVSGEGCRLCHNTDAGTTADLNRFGRLLDGYGVSARVVQSLRRALDRVENEPSDSDGDSASDYEEIVLDHTNPNDPKSHRVFEVPSEGGAGGESGALGGATADGGEPPNVEYPPAEPLPELPPPIWHGCTLASTRSASGLPGLVVLVLAFGLALWRRVVRP